MDIGMILFFYFYKYVWHIIKCYIVILSSRWKLHKSYTICNYTAVDAIGTQSPFTYLIRKLVQIRASTSKLDFCLR